MNLARYGQFKSRGVETSSFVMPVAPLAEQRRICNFVEAELGKLGALNREAGLAITLLGDRHGAPIAAAVTCQIDVRGAVPLPAQPEELAA